MRLFFLPVFCIFFLSDLTAQQYFTGLIFDDDQYDQSVTLANQSIASFQNLPKSASLKKYSPKPGNQIRFGTSVGWAAAWGARTILESRLNNWEDRDYITRQAFSPIFAYQMSRSPDDVNCNLGSRMEELLNIMKYTGSVKYVDFLEFCPDEIPGELYVQASNHSISEYNKLFERNDGIDIKIKATKKAISQNFPVVIGMYCPPSFLNAKDFWQPKEVVTNKTPGHAVCIVGYDDEKFGGAFEILNSWGKNWGNNGFTWIRYDDFADYVKYAYELILLAPMHDVQKMFGTAQVVNNDLREISAIYKSDGVYTLDKSFQTGDRFRLSINNCSRGYFYIIGSGASNDFSLLFPYDNAINGGLVYELNNLSIPDEQHFIQVTGDETEDYLYLIFSLEPLDIEYLIEKMKLEMGNSREIVHRILGNQFVQPEDVQWDKWSMSFNATAKKGEISIMTVQFLHD